MAITRHLASLIVSEHLFRPIEGNVLLLGRQVVFMSPDEAQALVESLGARIRAQAVIEYDKNEYGRSQKFISDSSFFSLFSDSEVRACDVSDYEKADMIFDLSGKLPDGLEGKYDFIYNGSVLDNVFDPAACMRNVSRMLKTSGVVMHYEGALHCFAAYLKFSPEWFFDYYTLNGFEDAQIYFVTFSDVYKSPWDMYEWDAFVNVNGRQELAHIMENRKDAMVIAVAQNNAQASTDRTPIQGSYRKDHDDFLTGYLRYSKSGRRKTYALSCARVTTEATAAETPKTDAPPTLSELLVAYGRSSMLRRFVPLSVKRLLVAKAAARKAPAQTENDAIPKQAPGYRYLGKLG